MLTPEKCQDIFSLVRRCSTADETEVLIRGGRTALTRFANNSIHQNMAEDNYVVSIRTVFGGRTARATTNRFDEESIKRAVQASERLARVQEPDPDLLPLPEATAFANGQTVGRAFFETASLSASDRAAAVAQMARVAEKHGLTTAGVFSNSESVEAVANSRGLLAYHTQTSSEISVTMIAADSSGWQKANSPDVRNLDPVALAEAAARKAVDSANPRELPPGPYTVVLEPAAVLDLVGFMFWDWGGLAVLDQRSFLNNRIGSRLFGENVSISDDVYHALQSGAPFDGEGCRRQRVSLVEQGVVHSLVYARATARKMRASEYAGQVGPVQPTGHGFPLPNEMGEAPLNIVFATPPAGRAKTVDEMISGTDRGILVTRLWYIREVDPYEKILTGMTRDGTFYIEDGKLRYGLRNFRFNESVIDMLSHVEDMSDPVRASGEESFDMVVPAMKVSEFNFTEVTKF